MAEDLYQVELTASFLERLEAIEVFLTEAEAASAFDALLADLYGPRVLFQEGLLPPALALRHSGYLRPMIGVQPPGGLRLHIVAFDIARGPDEIGRAHV